MTKKIGIAMGEHKQRPLKVTRPGRGLPVRSKIIPRTPKVGEIKGPRVGLLHKATRAQRLNKKYNG